MIELADGCDVADFLRRVTEHVGRYSEVILCSPFIDSSTLANLRELADASYRRGTSIAIVTSRATLGELSATLHAKGGERIRLIACKDLHAKFYLAVGRYEQTSEVIVTSANLTTRSVTANIELGVRAVSSTPLGRDLVLQTNRFASRLVLNGRCTWKRH